MIQIFASNIEVLALDSFIESTAGSVSEYTIMVIATYPHPMTIKNTSLSLASSPGPVFLLKLAGGEK